MEQTLKTIDMENLPPMLTVGDAANILQISRRNLYDLIEQWGIPYTRLSERRIRIPRDGFLAWLKSQTAQEKTKGA